MDREVDGPTELERRGWRYVRVLTADVFADADAEADRVAGLWRDALADAGHDLPWVVDLVAPAVTVDPDPDPDPGRDPDRRRDLDPDRRARTAELDRIGVQLP
ncbi:hypothetical protein [Kineococcus mangrovi]|uniref:hypothetical protein n=1 Tax=Kineococcus mangrovi TaxID=1660183 RepID=UPI003D7E29F0